MKNNANFNGFYGRRNPIFSMSIGCCLSIALSASAAPPAMASLSDYTFDPSQVAAFFDRNGGMTSAKKVKFERELFEKGLPQPWGARLLYHAIPDGTVFEVETVYERVDDNPEVIAIELSLVSDDGSRWEYCHTAGCLPETGDYSIYRGSDWPQAPWKKQDRTWQETFIRTCYPGRSYGFSPRLWVYRSASSEEKLKTLNAGSFLLSQGWFVGLLVADAPNERPALRGQYMLFPSESDVLAIAHRGKPESVVEFNIVPPRDKRDIILSRMVKNHGRLVGLVGLLKAAKKHLKKIQPGEAFGRIVEECVGRDYFKELVHAAYGSEKGTFDVELDRAIRKLSELEDRCKSAAILEPGFDDYELDMAATLDLKRDGPKLGNMLRRVRTFEEKLWGVAHSSKRYKDYYRCAFQAFPDDVSFVVRDVKSFRLFWMVTLEALVYDQVPYIWRSSGDRKWTEDPRQDHFFWTYMRERFGGGEGTNEYVLCLPKTRTDVEDWDPGRIIKSDGWIRETLLENSVVTKRQNGREWKENTREVHLSSHSSVGPSVLWTSLKDRLDIEAASSK